MQLLIWLGRHVLVAAAALTILAHVIVGWIYGAAQDRFYSAMVPSGHISTTPVMFAVLGLVVGLIVAGAFWGLAAAIFDMQRSLQMLCENRQKDRSGPTDVVGGRDLRSEPRLRGSA